MLDFAHRAGNVHDSRGALAFMTACVDRLRRALSGVQLEVRLDSAFFSEELVAYLDAAGIEFTISVPFERFVELKGLLEGRQRWHRITEPLAYFESALEAQELGQSGAVCVPPLPRHPPAGSRAGAAGPVHSPRVGVRVQGDRHQ